jgi:outer membrane biosynthesis protein TonB
MRRDLITMGAIAAVVGIGLAALLTASFGASSSGPPAALRPAEAAPEKAPAPVAKKVEHKPRTAAHRRRKAHRPKPSPRPAPAPSTVATPTPLPEQTQTTETVATPAPVAAPVKQLSRPAPKRKAPEGATFDDSG